MEEVGLDFSQTERNPAKKFVGIALVTLLHVMIIYALATGLARKVVEVIQQPLETKIIEDIKPPPPPDKPPPPPPPKLAAPPPPFIPPPEVQIQQPVQQNVIQATTTVRPTTTELAPVAKVVDPAPPAPAAPPVRVAAVVDPNACAKPEYPRASLRAEETGVVTLAFLIGVDGRVVDARVEKSSGFKGLDAAARAGLSLCKFKPGSIDGKPEQSWTKMQYVWKLED